MGTAVKILVVDDEPIVHLACLKSFGRPERQFLRAESVCEAREKLEAHPDLSVSLVDKNLPDGNGITLIREMRERVPTQESIMITGYASQEAAISAFRAGAFDFVEKPFKTAELEGKLQDAIDAVAGARERDLRARHNQKIEAIGLLAAGVGHEINNPLSGVIGNLDYIVSTLAKLRGDRAAEVYDELVEATCEAREGAQRIRRIVAALKTFSARDRDDGLVHIDLNRAVESALSLMRNQILHRAELVVRLARAPSVVGHEQQLCQVLINVLLNALHAVPQGRSGSQIRVATRAGASGAVIEVSDNGCGIPAHIMPRIFDPFFTTKDVNEGTGLGLSLSREMMAAMDGSIEIESTEGEGTRVFVSLTLASALASRPVPRSANALEPASPTVEELTPMKILLVDDELIVLKTMARLLLPHAVETASDGSKALAMLEGGEFDMVLCDLMMPEVSGMDLYEMARERDPSLADRFVFMSGGVFTPHAQAFVKEHEDRVLNKPVTKADLQRVIAELGERDKN